jgi:heat shock protein HslJ
VAPGIPITNVLWEWERVSGNGDSELTVEDMAGYTLVLSPDGRVEFQADCNSGSGNYALEGSSLTLELVPGTTALCGEDSLHDEYLRMLGNVGTYVIDDGRLLLNLKAEGGSMVFADGGPASQP